MSKHKPTCVIASTRPWNRVSGKCLTDKTPCHFIFISDPDRLTASFIKEIEPRFIFFPHWSYAIPEEIYGNFECIIFHMTDLPYGRGGSPLQNLIQRDIERTKMCALRCVKEIDAGPIYLRKPLCLHGSAEEIYLRANQVIENMIIEIIKNKPVPTPQVGKAVIFKRRKPEQSNLTQAINLNQVFDLIRMLDADGYPRAFMEIGSLRFEFSRAQRKVGEVIADVKITHIDINNDA